LSPRVPVQKRERPGPPRAFLFSLAAVKRSLPRNTAHPMGLVPRHHDVSERRGSIRAPRRRRTTIRPVTIAARNGIAFRPACIGSPFGVLSLAWRPVEEGRRSLSGFHPVRLPRSYTPRTKVKAPAHAPEVESSARSENLTAGEWSRGAAPTPGACGNV
jgi:hypothetical protein